MLSMAGLFEAAGDVETRRKVYYGRGAERLCCGCRLDAPFGTEDKPVEVTSSFSERIVGVPDPYDDSIVWWGNIHEGDPPKQIVEGGEFFILKRSEDAGHGH